MSKFKGHKYFIQEHLQEPYRNGGIGYTDMERILAAEGYQAIFFPCHHSHSLISKIRRFVYLITIFFRLPERSVVVFLLPQYAGMNKLLVRLLGRRHSVRRVAVVGDINGLKHQLPALLQQELRAYGGYDYLILHNRSMQSWMSKQLPVPSSVLHFFDFLAPMRQRAVEYNNGIVYAGNLEEALFLEQLDQLAVPAHIQFKVYGEPLTEKMRGQSNLQYMGISTPYELPEKAEGSFGLVWYGEAFDRISGPLGAYLPLISPHKASLYILSGMPLIVQEDMGIAPLVKEYGIGITLKNLHGLQEALSAVSSEQFAIMSGNTRALARKIASGNGLRKALLEMEKALEQGFDRKA